MHFHESTIITTTEGLHCQVYSNQHPEGSLIVKPKYIPTNKISSNALPFRFISGKKMNRLNLWIDKENLKEYIELFSKSYPHYILNNPMYDQSPIFFAVPQDKIERTYYPREGLSELMSMPHKDLDPHLQVVVNLINFLLQSNLELNDIGITYSTLMGHYSPNMSDINIVVYGKNNFWKLMEFLGENKHPDLRWKDYREWEDFYKKRNRHILHNKENYIKNMHRKKSEGYFKDTLFVIFAVENEDEAWFKWGEEKYKKLGSAKIKAAIINNKNSVVRPGCYEISNSEFIDGNDSCKNIPISKVVFYSRDYCMIAYPDEKIEASGVVEQVTPNSGETYNRLVLGYFDSYIQNRRDNEYIKTVD